MKSSNNQQCEGLTYPKNFTFYHFVGRQHLESIIKTGCVKTSQLAQSNDPLEYLPDVDKDADLREWVTQSDNYPLIACLTARCTSSVMWGHYAEKHTGICLAFCIPLFASCCDRFEGFNIPPENKIYYLPDDTALMKVIYSDDRIPLFAPNSTEKQQFSLIYQMLMRKSPEWDYEREYRLFLADNPNLKAENGIILYSGLKEYLDGIILGCKCPLTEQYVNLLLRGENSAYSKKDVKVSRAEIPLHGFDMKIPGYQDINMEELESFTS